MWLDAKYWSQRAWLKGIKWTEVTVTRIPFDVHSNSSPFLFLCRGRLSRRVHFLAPYLACKYFSADLKNARMVISFSVEGVFSDCIRGFCGCFHVCIILIRKACLFPWVFKFTFHFIVKYCSMIVGFGLWPTSPFGWYPRWQARVFPLALMSQREKYRSINTECIEMQVLYPRVLYIVFLSVSLAVNVVLPLLRETCSGPCKCDSRSMCWHFGTYTPCAGASFFTQSCIHS